MPIARIKKSIQPAIEDGHRFCLLYGRGIDDVFLSDDGRELDFPHTLHTELKARGYQRIAFISPSRPVFFLDAESEQAARPTVAAAGSVETNHKSRRKNKVARTKLLKNGPMGDLNLLAQQPPTPQVDGAVTTGSADVTSHNYQVGDTFAIRRLNAIMQDASIKSAVVFLQAQDTLTLFRETRVLAGIIGEWMHLPTTNENICILAFSSASYESLCEESRTIPVALVQRWILRQGKTGAPILVGTPDREELHRIVWYCNQGNRYRLDEMDENDLNRVVDAMYVENQPARTWIARLKTLDSLTLDALRSRGWLTSKRFGDKSAWERLDELTGVDDFKCRIRELCNWYTLHRSDNISEENVPSFHMLFIGHPGTGKTTCAELVGELAHDIGLLERGHLVVANCSDLVAGYVGQTAIKTNAKIDEALDGVLFIDEGYMLVEPERGGFGREALDTLTARMDAERHRLIVVVALYPDKEDLFLSSNPGLSRRFPTENRICFPDFTVSQLIEIAQTMCKRRNIPMDDRSRALLAEIVAGMYADRDASFGNAGEIRNLVDSLDFSRSNRLVAQGLPADTPLCDADVGGQYRHYLTSFKYSEAVFASLDNIIGLEEVKATIRGLAQKIVLEKARQQRNPAAKAGKGIQHIAFAGAPGTGKTMTAEAVADIFREVGLLKRGHVVKAHPTDALEAKIGEALDGVLFMDEVRAWIGNTLAYSTLLTAMTTYSNRLVVIIADYPENVLAFLTSDPGLRSRFRHIIYFPDYSADELYRILELTAEEEHYRISPEAKSKLYRLFDAAIQQRGRLEGNGRSVKDTLFDEMKTRMAARLLANGLLDSQDLDTFLPEDVPGWFGIDDGVIYQDAPAGEEIYLPQTTGTRLTLLPE